MYQRGTCTICLKSSNSMLLWASHICTHVRQVIQITWDEHDLWILHHVVEAVNGLKWHVSNTDSNKLVLHRLFGVKKSRSFYKFFLLVRKDLDRSWFLFHTGSRYLVVPRLRGLNVSYLSRPIKITTINPWGSRDHPRPESKKVFLYVFASLC